MKKISIFQVISGVGFFALCAGLLVFGLAFGSALSGDMKFSDHMLFLPGLFCMGMGMLSLAILYLSGTDGQAS